MNERTRLLGGVFMISSIPSVGTQVEAAISLSTLFYTNKQNSHRSPFEGCKQGARTSVQN